MWDLGYPFWSWDPLGSPFGTPLGPHWASIGTPWVQISRWTHLDIGYPLHPGGQNGAEFVQYGGGLAENGFGVPRWSPKLIQNSARNRCIAIRRFGPPKWPWLNAKLGPAWPMALTSPSKLHPGSPSSQNPQRTPRTIQPPHRDVAILAQGS